MKLCVLTVTSSRRKKSASMETEYLVMRVVKEATIESQSGTWYRTSNERTIARKVTP